MTAVHEHLLMVLLADESIMLDISNSNTDQLKPENQGMYHRSQSVAPNADSLVQQHAADSNSLRDSACASLETRTRDELRETSRKRRKIPGTKYYIFEYDVNEDAIKSYRKVLLSIEDELTDAIPASDITTMSLKLRIIGEDDLDAALRLVIFCAAEVEERVRSVMGSSRAQNLLSSPVILNSRRNDVPDLEYRIIPKAPRGRSAEWDFDVCCENTFVDDKRTFCGAPIIFRAGAHGPGHTRCTHGTFGGTIKIVHGDGTFSLHGMTAGHAVQTLHTEQVTKKQSGGSDGFIGGIERWICEHNILGTVLNLDDLPGVTSRHARPSHDWALFNLESYRPNVVVDVPCSYIDDQFSKDDSVKKEDLQQVLFSQRPIFNDNLSEPVLLVGGMKGSRRGELSNLPARLWIGQAECFVDAYTLELNDDYEGDPPCSYLTTLLPTY
jgi:hypothetical protein